MSNNSVDRNASRTSARVGVALLFVGALFRILSYYFSTNTGGDARERVFLSADWLQHPTLKFIFGVYPPGHFWLIGASTLLVHDVVVAGRLLSLGLGIASLLIFWRLARILYGDAAGLLSLAVSCLYSMHIAYSATSSSEVSYLFFLLLAMFFFFSYLQSGSKKLRYLGVSGVFLSIAESIRFEAWAIFLTLLVLLPIMLVWGSPQETWRRWNRFQPLLVFGVTGGIWPVFMMAYCWRAFGDPMYLVTLNHARVIQTFAIAPSPLSYQLALTPGVLIISLSPLAFAAAIYGLVKSFSLRLPAAFAGLTLFFAAVQCYEIFSSGLLALARYTLTLGTMLAIISGYGLQQICERFAPRKLKLAYAVTVGLLFLNPGAVLALSELPNRYADKFASVSPRLRYPTRIAGVGEYLREHMGPEDAVVIDDYNVESDIVAEAAGLPILLGRRAYLASAANKIGVREYISAEHPRFLVYSDQGTLRHWLVLPSDCNGESKIAAVQFHCRFANQIYRVYELSYH